MIVNTTANYECFLRDFEALSILLFCCFHFSSEKLSKFRFFGYAKPQSKVHLFYFARLVSRNLLHSRIWWKMKFTFRFFINFSFNSTREKYEKCTSIECDRSAKLGHVMMRLGLYLAWLIRLVLVCHTKKILFPEMWRFAKKTTTIDSIHLNSEACQVRQLTSSHLHSIVTCPTNIALHYLQKLIIRIMHETY